MLLFLATFAAAACSAEPADRCLQPKVTGRCRGRQYNYYFNSQSKRCEMFIYGGCGGNDNRFTSLASCHESCKHIMEVPDASVHVKGTRCLGEALDSSSSWGCRAYIPRYTFNSRTLSCKEYIYGGCNAGPNLFMTRRDCLASCVYGADSILGRRGKAIGRGSLSARVALGGSDEDEGEEVPLVAPSLPNTTDICDLPPEKPSLIRCLAAMQRWTFDRRQNKCVKYIYSGCDGTENLFSSEEDCLERCPPKIDLKPGQPERPVDACDMPKHAGDCKGAHPKFAFNKQTKRCELFLYGGCGGNANNFDTMEECVAACGGTEPCTNLACSHVKCDHGEMIHNQAKGCKPVIAPGGCCPSAWDCSVWEERLKRRDECFVANSNFPNGKFYSVGEKVPEADAGCRVGCTCVNSTNGNARLICAIMDCAWHQLGENCVTLYKDVDQCCPSTTECYESKEDIQYLCELDGRSYAEGAAMYPDSERCKVCHCQSGWSNNATLEENAKFCREVDCGLSASGDDLLRGCQPVFSDRACCPIDWVCPRKKVPPLPPLPPPMVVCPPGVRPLPFKDYIEITREAMDLADAGAEHLPSAPGEENERDVSVCLLPRPISACEGYLDRWFFDRVAGTCKHFMFGDESDVIGNVFVDEASCLETCSKFASTADKDEPQPSQQTSVCMEPKSPGPCLAYFPMYYFDSNTNTCRIFVYGGCGGTGNRFDTIDKCVSACPVDEKAQKRLGERCSLPLVLGECPNRAEGPIRWYFDRATDKCKSFRYGGCEKNENNFETVQECELACKFNPSLLERDAVGARSYEVVEEDFLVSPCLLPKEVGLCRALLPRYYFDQDAGECLYFDYGGCGGNENNFMELTDCKAKCAHLIGARQPKTLLGSNSDLSARHGDGVCRLKPQPGPCYAYFMRHYFDPETNSCKRFVYGGCRGNANNFRDEESCMRRCGGSGSAEVDKPATCGFDGRNYPVGATIRSLAKCTVCTCSSPPNLTCKRRYCPPVTPSDVAGGERCEPVYDEDGCCVTGYRCV